MKVAIIGGGFYGTFLAYKLGVSHEVTLYEKSDQLMNRSAIYNQCRLHQGFHYPRCAQTILQTSQGFNRFLKDFSQYTKKIDQNIYAIHLEGKSSFDLLRKNIGSIEFKITHAPPVISDQSAFETFIVVEEKMIVLHKLSEFLIKSLSVKVNLSSEVQEIDSLSGKVKTKSGVEEFDLIINASFTNPNLGLPHDDQFSFLYELAAMVCMDATSPLAEAITIIDGDYVSLYPNYLGQKTLSSVLHTPFFQTSHLDELEDAWTRRSSLSNDLEVMEKIISHGREFLNLSEVNNPSLWIAPKVKLKVSVNDNRVSFIKSHDKLISIFCGKLDSVYSVWDEIEDYICKKS